MGHGHALGKVIVNEASVVLDHLEQVVVEQVRGPGGCARYDGGDSKEVMEQWVEGHECLEVQDEAFVAIVVVLVDTWDALEENDRELAVVVSLTSTKHQQIRKGGPQVPSHLP